MRSSSANRSDASYVPYIGVYSRKGKLGWESSIYVSNAAVLQPRRQVHLGTSETRAEASMLYDIAAYKLFGRVVNNPLRLVQPYLVAFNDMSFTQTVDALRKEAGRAYKTRRRADTPRKRRTKRNVDVTLPTVPDDQLAWGAEAAATEPPAFLNWSTELYTSVDPVAAFTLDPTDVTRLTTPADAA